MGVGGEGRGMWRVGGEGRGCWRVLSMRTHCFEVDGAERQRQLTSHDPAMRSGSRVQTQGQSKLCPTRGSMCLSRSTTRHDEVEWPGGSGRVGAGWESAEGRDMKAGKIRGRKQHRQGCVRRSHS